MPRFSAHVQYDDWKGTAAADDADTRAIRKYLRDNGLINSGEFLVGLELYSGESHFAVRAFIIQAGDYEGAVKQITANPPVDTLVRELSLGRDEFFAMFKRFSVVLTHKGLELDGEEYRERDG
jgi:hypothetical protein